MSDVTVIGRGAVVVGNVSGAVDLSILGRVEGDIAVQGEVTIEPEGLVAANVAGQRVVVRGAVKGSITADEAIRLEEGARVVGDLRAPRVAVTRGALVRGYVQTSGSGADAARAKAVRPAVKPVTQAVVAGRKPGPPALLAGTAPKPTPKGPPPPVVPVLRKGAKGTLKKKVG